VTRAVLAPSSMSLPFHFLLRGSFGAPGASSAGPGIKKTFRQARQARAMPAEKGKDAKNTHKDENKKKTAQNPTNPLLCSAWWLLVTRAAHQ